MNIFASRESREDPKAANGEVGGAPKASSGGGYRYDTPEEKETLERHKKVIWKWIKSVGSKILSDGVNLTKISLPVELFESKSFLERVCDSWGYLQLLLKGSECTDPVERMRFLIAFAVSGLSLQVNAAKPFNPILGETFQGEYDGGIEVFCEQISHHPPISCWEVTDEMRRFRFSGTGHICATTRANSVKAQQKGDSNVFFYSDGATVSWNLPGLVLKNVMFGERHLKYSGEMVFRDAKNGLECVIKVDPSEEKSVFSKMQRSLSKSKSPEPNEVYGELKKDGVVVDRCEGSWLSHLDWGLDASRSRYWTRMPDACVTPSNCGADALESDCRRRIDVQALQKAERNVNDKEMYKKCIDEAQSNKELLERHQRSDAKLRKEGLKAQA